jgi:ubiquinone/menaquinone biosynthesis C-methylase UbiE
MVKLNLGSGINGHAALNVISLDHTGWKNIEIQEAYKADEHYDITTGIREPDNSVEEIWMGDFFEHLLRLKAKFVMSECYRVLQPGGRLRMSVPDMSIVMPLWLAIEGRYEWAPLIANGAPVFNPTFVQELYDCIWGGQDRSNQVNSLYDSHFNGYTEKSLQMLMFGAGFTKMNRIGIHRTWYELAMEAYK